MKIRTNVKYIFEKEGFIKVSELIPQNCKEKNEICRQRF